MQLFPVFVEKPYTITLGTLISCSFYALVLVGFMFYQHRKKIAPSPLVRTLTIWLFLAPASLFVLQFFLGGMLVFILGLLITMISLHIYVSCVDVFAKAPMLIQALSVPLLLLFTFNVVPQFIYNILVLIYPPALLYAFPDTSLPRTLIYFFPILWIVLDTVIVIRLKKLRKSQAGLS